MPKSKNAWLPIALLVAAVAIIWAGASGLMGEAKPIEWSEDFSPEISRTLAAKGISGCGQYRFHSAGAGEYVVQCTRDGSTWVEYRVFPRTGDVIGPLGSAP